MSFLAKIQPQLQQNPIDVRTGHDACQENDLEELIKAVDSGVLRRQIFTRKTLLLEVSFKGRYITDQEHTRKQEDFFAEVRLSLMAVGLECKSIRIISRSFVMKTPMEKSILIGIDLRIEFI